MFVDVKLRELDENWPRRLEDGPSVLRTVVIVDLLGMLYCEFLVEVN